MKRKKTIKNIFIVLLLLLVLIQFIRPKKNIDPLIATTDITRVVKVPDTVLHILKTACYDCHSNNTNYYWYHEVMPIGYWLNDHVKDGKKHFNFSDFANYPLKKKDHKLEEVEDEVKEHEMPLNSYTWVHKDAQLNDAQIKLIVDWAKDARNNLR